jgi:fibrillarin-like rRNA methylase
LLAAILANCKDFKDLETALEYLGTQLGVTVKLTPKFHADIAGEGVKYSWAHSKSIYRRLSLSQKRGQEDFKQLVRDCTCPKRVLTKVRIEKFTARASCCTSFFYHSTGP